VFDHVTIRVSDRGASERFYNTVLAVLDIQSPKQDADYVQWDDFSILPSAEGEPITRRLHIGFVAASRSVVAEFWRVGREAGYEDAGAPGPRPEYGGDYYGGFLFDPDGNSIEAVHHGSLRAGGLIDHLWFRVADLATTRVFYETIAPYAGFRLGRSTSDRAQFSSGNGSFSMVSGRPTEPFHLAFPATEDATVAAFHRAALAAGYADNGSPGERAQYHAGYYAAFVLDPGGNNVEVVNHNRS
jgi:catechol 2,3-dioxygenase-like lactoylglutathione lyase family enzyme